MIGLVEGFLVAYLPGAVLFRLPLWDRPRRARLLAEERAFWAVVLSLAWSCGIVIALAAVNQYKFEYLLAIDACLAGGLALRYRGRLGYGGQASRPTASVLVPVGLIALGAWLYFPSAEWVVGGKDPGVYLSEGVQVAKSGGLVVRDHLVSSVPPRFWDLFFPSYRNRDYYSLRFMGFFLMDPRSGGVVGQFPHLFPASIAVGYGLLGLTGALATTGVWAIGGVLATYFLGARLFGRAVAGAAACLLAINVIEVWFARIPNSEVATQTLSMAALLAAARSLVDEDRFFGVVAGAILGLMLFTRFDAALLAAGVVAAVVLAPLARQRMGVWFWVPLVGLASLAVRYLWGILRPYGRFPLGFVLNEGGPLVALALVSAAVIVHLAARSERIRRPLERAIPVGGAVAIAALALYAYFFRHAGGRLAEHDAAAFRTFAWYVTTPGLALAVAGAVVFVYRRFWNDPGFVLGLGASALFVFYKVRIIPEHFWLARRFLTLILPATVLFAVALFSPALWRRGDRALAGAPRATLPRERFMVGATALVAISLGCLFFLQTRAVIDHVEFGGLRGNVEALARRFGDRDLVLVESRSASDMHVFATPLAYLYDKHVLVLASPRPDKAALEGFLEWANRNYDAVYFLGGGGTDLLSRRIAVAPVASERFQVPEWDAPRNHYPTEARMREFDYGLYRFANAERASGRFDLQVGVADDVYAIRFHAKEIQESWDQPFRWTRDSSYIALPNVTEATSTVTLWLSDGGRPASLGPCRVRVSFDGEPLGDITAQRAILPYTFTIPPALVRQAAGRDDPARLGIQSSTWVPSDAHVRDDARSIGIMLTRVEVR